MIDPQAWGVRGPSLPLVTWRGRSITGRPASHQKKKRWRGRVKIPYTVTLGGQTCVLEWLVVFRESSTAFLEGFRDGKAEEVRHNVNFAESFRNAFEKISTEIEKTKK